MSIDSCQETEGQQCIAFPQKKREREHKRSTLQRAVNCKINGRIEGPREGKRG